MRFYFFVTLFMGAMVGLATAQDLILLFLFRDPTAIASHYLIGFDCHSANARASALMALLITGVSAVLLLIGAVFLEAAYGTFSVPELAAVAEPGTLLSVCGLLIAVAGLAKCAQAPLHFWLPERWPRPRRCRLSAFGGDGRGGRVFARAGLPAFAAERPRARRAAGRRVRLDGVGGVLALTRDVMKQLLAYSTVAQYGFVVAMYGLGGPYMAGGAAFYVVAHAVAKSALFLTAGTVTEATGENRLSGLRG